MKYLILHFKVVILEGIDEWKRNPSFQLMILAFLFPLCIGLFYSILTAIFPPPVIDWVAVISLYFLGGLSGFYAVVKREFNIPGFPIKGYFALIIGLLFMIPSWGVLLALLYQSLIVGK
jgi:hypothetical protein